MGHNEFMTLEEYLLAHGITSRQFAKELKSSLSGVNKWRQQQRIPRPKIMERIIHLTKGKVRYEDWYKS